MSIERISRSDFSSRLLAYTRDQRVNRRLGKRSDTLKEQERYYQIAEAIRREEIKFRNQYENSYPIQGSRLA